jgi:hypothetical protein
MQGNASMGVTGGRAKEIAKIGSTIYTQIFPIIIPHHN